MSKIIFFNQRYLTDPRIKQVLTDCGSQHNWDAMLGTLTFYPRTAGVYCRAGTNILPFDTEICDLLDARIPNDLSSSDCFADVSDRRCIELWHQHCHRPWVIGWSGGVDSTVIITSVMRNLSQSQRKNIRVACNAASIYEYPWFFENVVKPNFETVSSSILYDPQSLDDSMVINGEPCDQLFPGAVLMPMIHRGQEIDRNMFTDPQGILNYLEQESSPEFAHWFYEQTIANIRSVDLGLTSYFDFFWWAAFNFNWTGVLLRSMRNGWVDLSSAKGFRERFISWFNYDPYQTWAINNRQQLIARNIGDYKKPCKDYIYEFTRDIYYHQFKTKTKSTSVKITNRPWVAVKDDWTLLTADQMDQVLDLLPSHIAK